MGTADLNLLREKAIKRKKVNSLLKEILIYSIFFSFLFITAFSNNDQNANYYQTQLKKLFGISKDDSSLSPVNILFYSNLYVQIISNLIVDN